MIGQFLIWSLIGLLFWWCLSEETFEQFELVPELLNKQIQHHPSKQCLRVRDNGRLSLADCTDASLFSSDTDGYLWSMVGDELKCANVVLDDNVGNNHVSFDSVDSNNCLKYNVRRKEGGLYDIYAQDPGLNQNEKMHLNAESNHVYLSTNPSDWNVI
jgi:hypothetical protein